MKRWCMRPALEGLETRRLMAARVLELEPNDIPAEAQVVRFAAADSRAVIVGALGPAGPNGERLRSGSASDAAGDVDHYRVVSTIRGRQELRIRRTDAEPGQITVEVMAGRRRLGGSRLAAGEGLSIAAPAGGRGIVVRVSGSEAEATDYRLTVGVAARPARRITAVGGRIREREPNETVALANPITLPRFGTVMIQGTGGAFDLDTFRLRPGQGGLLRIDYLGIAAEARYLVDSDEFPDLVGQFAPLAPGGSVVVPVFRGLRYRLRLVVDSPLPTPYLLRLQLLPPLLGVTNPGGNPAGGLGAAGGVGLGGGLGMGTGL
ncbi:MAG: hypothetical protein KatS3mg108_1448 [Isosphaeraceae bacterium]|jgi:hypothetical protein|nr:MAG: hypothetical protein KatS3mg108_1448 [Isosphaeraceae bacterium]